VAGYETYERMIVRLLRLLFLAVLIVAVPKVALAADPANGTILLLVHGDELPRERLRDLVAKELNKPVTLSAGQAGGASAGVVTVTYRQAAKELAVTWDGPKHGTVSRVISAPAKVDDVLRDAAILAGNLARDEADELVAPPPPLPSTETPPPPPPLPPPATEPAPAPVVVRSEEGKPKEKEDLTLGFFYPLSSNAGRPAIRTRIDFNLLVGRVGQLDGFQMGGVNVVYSSEGKGTGDVGGLQLAYVTNVAGGSMNGMQLSTFANFAGRTGKDVEGWQASTLLNRAAGNMTGLQTSMFINSVAGTMTGVQVGTLNLSGDMSGAQLGFINVGKKVNGTMIGLVNVADDVDGVPIGIASVTKSGGVHPQIWTSSATVANLGVKLATKHTYTMPSGHYHRAYDRDFVGAGFTIGGHIPINNTETNVGPYVDTDLSFAWLYAPERSASLTSSGAVDTYHLHLFQPRVRAMFGWHFAEHFAIYGGAGLLAQMRLIRDGEEAIIRLGPEFVLGVEL
jgi:hypothetical protein